eukprot:Rmarinus@m.20858
MLQFLFIAVIFVYSLPLRVSADAGATAELMPQYSLSPPFVSGLGRMNVPNWVTSGSTVGTDNFLRLTPAIKSRQGAIWNPQPSVMTSWEIILEFRVSGVRNPGADGFALWYTKQSGTPGPAFGNTESFTGIGVVFDTFDNDNKRNNPYVTVVYNQDGRTRFDQEHDMASNELTNGCVMFYRNRPQPARAKISYLKGQLTVEVDSRGNGRLEQCLSTKVNLPDGWFFWLNC